MRYERTGPPDTARHPPSGRRWRRPLPLSLVALCLAGAGAGLAASVASGPSGPDVEHGAAASAVARSFVQANVLAQNLGAPDPPGAAASWVLRPDPPVRGPGGKSRLALPEHGWIGPNGTVALLDPAEGARVEAAQAGAVRLVFDGVARHQQLEALRTLVAGEERSPGALVSPGGAKVAHWYSLHVTGSVAHVEALVAQWGQHDTVVGPPGSQKVVPSISTDAVDAAATLVRVQGQWKVTSLSMSPWQQPT